MPTIEIITNDTKPVGKRRVQLVPRRVTVEARAVRGQWAVHKPYLRPTYEAEKTAEYSALKNLSPDDVREMIASDIRTLTEGWTVSHVPTGLRIASADNLETAMAILRAIAKIELQDGSDGHARNAIEAALRSIGLRLTSTSQRLPPKPTKCRACGASTPRQGDQFCSVQCEKLTFDEVQPWTLRRKPTA